MKLLNVMFLRAFPEQVTAVEGVRLGLKKRTLLTPLVGPHLRTKCLKICCERKRMASEQYCFFIVFFVIYITHQHPQITCEQNNQTSWSFQMK